MVACAFAGPLVYLIVRTVQEGGDALAVVRSDTAIGPLIRTLLLAGSTSAACAVLGTALAWLVMRTDLPLRRLFRVLIALPLVIPSFVGAFVVIAAFAARRPPRRAARSRRAATRRAASGGRS